MRMAVLLLLQMSSVCAVCIIAAYYILFVLIYNAQIFLIDMKKNNKKMKKIRFP